MKQKVNTWIATALALTALTLTGCGGQSDAQQKVEKDGKTVVKVGVVGEYNNQWDTIKELLAEEGIEVQLV